MSKKLVAYFSAGGVTAGLARRLAEMTGAELYEIRPQIPYTEADLNWRDEKSRSTMEMNDPDSRPAITDFDAPVADHDVIFVGFPVWWYRAPTIINTFLEGYDFSGKTLVPFATSGSSGLGKTMKKLRPSVSEATDLKEGKRFGANDSDETVAAWVSGLQLD